MGQHFALLYDDLGAVVAELRAQGLQVSDPTAVGETGRQQAFTSTRGATPSSCTSAPERQARARGSVGDDAHVLAATARAELHHAVGRGEERVVPTPAHVPPG